MLYKERNKTMISIKHKYVKEMVMVILITIIIILAPPEIKAEIGEFQIIDSNKMTDELSMLASVTKVNYEKIKTLQGKTSFEEMVIYRGAYAADLVKRHAGITIKEPNEIAELSEGKCEFKVDFVKNLFFKYMKLIKPMEYFDIDNGISYQSVEGSSEMKKIITEKYEIESYPYTKKRDGTILSRAADKRARKHSEIITDDSDPRISFNLVIPVWELLLQFSEGLRSFNKGDINSFYNVVIEKAQTIKGITYRIQFTEPGASHPFETFVLDGEKGFNPTYIEVKNDEGIIISIIKTDFIKIEDIFLPSKRHVIQYDGNDGRLRREYKSTFTNLKVNMNLPENTFSIKNLGLSDGDTFKDSVEGKQYRYQDANLIPIKESE